MEKDAFGSQVQVIKTITTFLLSVSFPFCLYFLSCLLVWLALFDLACMACIVWLVFSLSRYTGVYATKAAAMEGIESMKLSLGVITILSRTIGMTRLTGESSSGWTETTWRGKIGFTSSTSDKARSFWNNLHIARSSNVACWRAESRKMQLGVLLIWQNIKVL